LLSAWRAGFPDQAGGHCAADAWRAPGFRHHSLTGAQPQRGSRRQEIVTGRSKVFAAARAEGQPDPALADVQFAGLARLQGDGLAGMQAGMNARLAVLAGKGSRLGSLVKNRKSMERNHGGLQIGAGFKRQA